MEFPGHLFDRLFFVVGRNGIQHEPADERLVFLSTSPASTSPDRIAKGIQSCNLIRVFCGVAS
jgi:hypothetical protein